MNSLDNINDFKERHFTIILIFGAVFSLIFDNIPKALQLNTLSGGYSSKLSWYFLFALLLISLYTIYKHGFTVKREEFGFIRYITVLLIVLFISNVWGLISYPYYTELLSGPSNQIEKLPAVWAFLNTHGISIEQKQLTMLWIYVRAFKTIIFTTLYTFGFSFILYHFFRENTNFYYHLVTKAVIAGIAFLSLYSIIEILYLAGSASATYFLTVINPMIHPIAVDHGWWPPLLWKGQLRSLFSEPSRMGNYLVFAMPFLWGKYLLSTKRPIGILILITFYTFMIFLTKARTAVAMYWGILFFLFLGIFYLHEKNLIKKFLCICGISLFSLALSIGFINMFMQKGADIQKVTLFSYMEDNIGSLGSSTKRSNGARYALIHANIVTGLEHPILGVGNVLESSYTVHNFNDRDLADSEVHMWVTHYDEQGPLRYGLDAMNEYVSRFAQNGLLGLLVYVFPFIYVFIRLLKILRVTRDENQTKVLVTMISLTGSAVVGGNGSLTLLYAYWIILAFSYAVVYSFDNKAIEYHETA